MLKVTAVDKSQYLEVFRIFSMYKKLWQSPTTYAKGWVYPDTIILGRP